jgi:hypothetical protein
MRDASIPVPRPLVLIRRTLEYRRLYGLTAAIRYVRCFLKRRLVLFSGREQRTRSAVPLTDDPLGLAAGEWVEVKPEADIRRSLDRRGRACGLGFMEGMTAFCGKRLRVYRRAECIILEGSGQVRRLKNTVLLEGAICDGEHYICDRSCFYFWKESWLKRVPREQNELRGTFE